MVPANFQIQTHGSSGKWGHIHECRVNWQEDPAQTIQEALKVCQRIKNEGYGVRLILAGHVLLSAPWQEPVELGHVVEI